MASTYFDDQCLGTEADKEWLLRGDDRTSAKCQVCPIPRNKIELSNMGERAFKSYAKGKKHCDRYALYIQGSRINFTSVSKGSAESPGESSICTCSSNLDKFVVPEAATDAEIRWCLKSVSSYSFRSCDRLVDLFSSMFPESTIAEKLCLQKDKCAYFVNHDIAPHFRSILMNNVLGTKNSEFYAISFDESLNTVIKMGQIYLVVNVWDNVNKMCTCYLESTFIGHEQHQDLFKHFISALDSLNLKKLQQVSMDGPNVNWAFFSELRNYRTENDMSKLLSTGSGGLHSIHGASKTREQSTDWKLKNVLSALHHILHDSPARRSD